jgi:hypothetical protein
MMGSFINWMDSVDLPIEQASGDNSADDWLRIDEQLHREFNARARNPASMVQGRVVYEVMEEFWPRAREDASLPDLLGEWRVGGAALASRDGADPFGLIEAASAGSCILRVVSSSYGTEADGENEYLAVMVAGWGEIPFGPTNRRPGSTTSEHLNAAHAKEGTPQ